MIKSPEGSDALEIANKYQESGLTRFSHPNFICEVELHQVFPNDPFFFNQFSLHNVGQVFTDGHAGIHDADIDAPEAWAITQGNNDIIIAVLDEGVTPNHPDLPNTRQVRLNGSNFADGDPNNPSPTGDRNHGNACAGIIAATQDNNQGIVGIAPSCRIMPIRIFNSNGSGITPQEIADAIDFARLNGAHIISNSWGFRSDNPNLYPVIKDAIEVATTQGRNGLGCVVVFSASNSANHVNGVNGQVQFPSNVDIAGVLTVGASDREDLQANYSPMSNPNSANNQIIDIVAPSHRAYSCQIPGETFECWSIDIPGLPGYNTVKENDCGPLPGVGTLLPNPNFLGLEALSYTGRFGGTSYSCPQVAAVAALVLAINPNLNHLEVFDILTSAADRVGGYVYTNNMSNELGFGRLNACQAVTQAVSTVASITGPTTVCTSNTTFTLNNLPVGCTVSWTRSSNLTYVSGQGTASYTVKAASSTVNGAGWVQATISGPCGDVEVDPYDLWVGTPPSARPTVQLNPGFSSVCKGETHLATVSPQAGITDYQWRLIYPDGFSWSLPSGSSSTTFCINSTGGPYRVGVKQRTDGCSWSQEVTTSFYVEDCGTGGTCGGGGLVPRLIVSPNPTSYEVTIAEVEPANDHIPWVLRLMSPRGAEMVNVTTTLPKTINVQGLHPGVYVLHARRGEYVEQLRVVVE